MPQIDLDSIVAELTSEVEARRRRGEYPPGLESQLESGFTAMIDSINRYEVDTSRLRHDIDRIGDSMSSIRGDYATTSRVPGGSMAHSVAGRVIQRGTGPLAESVRGLAGAISTSLLEVAQLFDAQRSADERQLQDVLSSVLDRLAILDHLVELLRQLEVRVDALESASRQL